mgnify:FL=1
MSDEIVYSYINDIAQRLKERRKYGRASLMVGSGFSKNALCKGMTNIQPPNWTELAEKMYDELYPLSSEWDKDQKEKWKNQRDIKTSGKNVTKLAEEYIANFDRDKMNTLIEQSIADDMFIPGELHKRLLKLDWANIFTTNYDTLLEQTVDMIYREENYKIIYSQNDLPGSTGTESRIIKLHGSIPQIKPYIICDEDYRTYPDKYAALVNTVQQAMLETRLCLIGFSGDDPNFQSWLGWLRDNMGEYCPKIYLIGVYDDLSSPERKLLENKGITIVDLSVFVSREEENRHYQAISKLLDFLEREPKDKKLYKEKPFRQADSWWNPEDEKKYVKKIEEYSDEVLNDIESYVLLPEKQRKEYGRYFHTHFSIVLRLKTENITPKVLINIIKILRKCLMVLDDSKAECLEKIRSVYEEEKDRTQRQNIMLCEIALYLAEMYRIDGKKTEYDKNLQLLEKYIKRVPQYANEVVIEKAKDRISVFEYVVTEELVDKIQESSFIYKVKKAGLYKQLNQKEKADRILSECSAELAQMKISDEMYSAYLGYLNLCYRLGNYEIKEEFSDSKYFDNIYNTRQIIIKQRENLEKSIAEEEEKNKAEILPFRMNAGKTIRNTIYFEESLYDKCFEFIIAIDSLCLPIFSDQKKLLPKVIDELLDSSESKYWKMAMVARCNDEKIISQVFTRKTILKMNERDRETLFENVLQAIQLYCNSETNVSQKYIVSIKCMLVMLSHIAVFIEESYIINFINVLCKFSNVKNNYEKEIFEIIGTISTRFNARIAKECQKIIFTDFASKYCLARYFGDIRFEIEEGYAETFYVHALTLLQGTGENERENGIAQILILWKNKPMIKYVDQISSVIWKCGADNLPSSEVYYPIIWEELPHPSKADFAKLYYQYIQDYEFVLSVTEQGFISNNSMESVRCYLNFFYMTSEISTQAYEKINLDSNLAIAILNKVNKFIDHEKKSLERDIDFMGIKWQCERKFSYIGQLVSLIYAEAIKQNFIDEIREEINTAKNKLKECNINSVAIEMADNIEQKQYENCMDIFEKNILTKNQQNYSEIFTGIECMLFAIKENEIEAQKITGLFEKFFAAIKYMDIEYAEIIWNYLSVTIKAEIFLGEQPQRYIADAAKTCIGIYWSLADKGDQLYLNGIYNCVNTLKEYEEYLIREGVSIVTELQECIESAKNIPNYEMQNIWSK